MRRLFAVLALSLFLALPSSAFAAVSIFDFTGHCDDCSASAGHPVTARAELSLNNYQLGQQITSENFVAFHYDGTNLIPGGFTVSNSASLAVFGSINSPLPSPQNFGFLNLGGYSFQSSDAGFWFVLDTGVAADIGTGGIYADPATTVSGVPELSTWAMMLFGFSALGLCARSRFKQQRGATLPLRTA